ncbi:MAG: hypothetical protein MZV70_49450 [Desulfobacterales bacterium]|nr:hypothetical protein [Desulfobacterales bacterium]
MPPGRTWRIPDEMADGTRIFVYACSPDEDYQRTIYILSGITGINHMKEMDLVRALSGGENRVVVHPPARYRLFRWCAGRRSRLSKKIQADYLAVINHDDQSGKRFIALAYSMSHGHGGRNRRSSQGSCRSRVGEPAYVRLKSSAGMTPTTGEYIKYALYYIFAPHTPIVNMAGDPGRIENAAERREAVERNNDPAAGEVFQPVRHDEFKKADGCDGHGFTALRHPAAAGIRDSRQPGRQVRMRRFCMPTGKTGEKATC